MNHSFRIATAEDKNIIWEVLQGAIQRRKEDGSNQWQDGYPNLEQIQIDLDNHAGYVLTDNGVVVAYVALYLNDEPEYDNIEGEWLSNGDFVCFHRLAVAENQVGKGLAKIMFDCIEQFTKKKGFPSIKADTNFDNEPMKYLFVKTGYKYCGQVYFRGSPRKAYEKLVG